MSAEELLHLLQLGGFATALILGSSILAIAVALDRTRALWSVGADARALGDLVSRHLYRGDVEEARKACERSRSLTADCFLAGFSRYGRGSMEAVASAVDRERIQVALKLKGQLWVLGTIGATAPFVGLFGTVWGILRAFREMASTGQGGFAVVAAGISEALITTAAGILVAVVAVVLYNALSTRLGKVTIQLKLVCDEFVELLKDRPLHLAATQAAEAAPSSSTTPAPAPAA